MTAFLLAALLRLLSAAQSFDDGSGLLPLSQDDQAQTRIVWCVESLPCSVLDGGEYVGGTVQVSRIPLAPVNQDEYSPTEALDAGEYR